MTSFSNTYKRLGVDTRVWLVMLVVSILSIGVFGYNTAVDEPCIPPNIAINSNRIDIHNRFVAHEIVTFSISNINKKAGQVLWSFGDGILAKGSHVTHNYANEGRFIVTATVNGKCQETKVVHIVKGSLSDPNIITPVVLTNDIITGNFSPLTHQQTPFKCIAYAESYEWQILNRNDFPVKTGKETSFNFPNSGDYTLQLKLDNDRSKVFTKTIYVGASPHSNPSTPTVHLGGRRSAPSGGDGKQVQQSGSQDSSGKVESHESAPPPPPVHNENESRGPVLLTADRNFLTLLQGVVKGTKDVSDFDDYLCDRGNTVVIINNKGHTTLSDFCKDIKGNDRRRIDEVDVIRGDHSCVRSLNVVAKKRKLLGWNNY